MTILEAEEAITPATAQQLGLISFAMGSGLTMMAGFVLWTYFSAAATIPTPQDVKFINTLTTAAMIVTLFLIGASEVAWRSLLRKSPGPLSGRVHVAFIVRLACREGAGLLGMTVVYLAAHNGVLRAYPAYWVNSAPYVLFLGFLTTHWPSAGKLADDARGVLAASSRGL